MTTTAMPVLFLGHGSPMNAIRDSDFTRTLRRLGEMLPRPQAVLSISAHWETEGTKILSAAHPGKIDDFFGGHPALRALAYAPPGAPELAAHRQARAAPD